MKNNERQISFHKINREFLEKTFNTNDNTIFNYLISDQNQKAKTLRSGLKCQQETNFMSRIVSDLTN